MFNDPLMFIITSTAIPIKPTLKLASAFSRSSSQRTFCNYVIKIFHAEPVNVFIMYVCMKVTRVALMIHWPSQSNQKSNTRFAVLFCIQQKIVLTNAAYFRKPL
jgi:hypothetical protein